MRMKRVSANQKELFIGELYASTLALSRHHQEIIDRYHEIIAFYKSWAIFATMKQLVASVKASI